MLSGTFYPVRRRQSVGVWNREAGTHAKRPCFYICFREHRKSAAVLRSEERLDHIRMKI